MVLLKYVSANLWLPVSLLIVPALFFSPFLLINMKVKKMKNYKKEKWRSGSNIFQKIQDRKNKWSVTPGGKRVFGVRRWVPTAVEVTLTGNWDNNTVYQTSVPYSLSFFLFEFFNLSCFHFRPKFKNRIEPKAAQLTALTNKCEMLSSLASWIWPLMSPFNPNATASGSSFSMHAVFNRKPLHIHVTWITVCWHPLSLSYCPEATMKFNIVYHISER